MSTLLHKKASALHVALICTGMIFFSTPHTVFASSNGCTMSPFSKTFSQGEQVHFQGALIHHDGAQGMEMHMGDLPRNVAVGFVQPRQENPTQIDLYFAAGPTAQIGSFNVVLFFTERLQEMNITSHCLVNIVIKESQNKNTASAIVTPDSFGVVTLPTLYASIDHLGERTAVVVDIIALSKSAQDEREKMDSGEISPRNQSAITTTSTQRFLFSKRLRIGVHGIEVQQLQKTLTDLGFFPSTVAQSGYFGPITKEAVKKFQKENKLPILGIVGPQTILTLNNFLIPK